MSSRQSRRHEIKRQHIVEAAAEVFAEVGIQDATLEQIGERVGLTKASLYYYFSGKEQLLIEVLARVLAEIRGRAAELTEDSMDPLQKLEMLARAYVESSLELPAGRLVVANLDTLVGNRDAADLMRRHEEPARRLFAAARRLALVGDVDTVVAIKTLYGALNNLPRWYNRKHGSPEAVFLQTWAIFTDGVLTR